ncbi:hypothetical protein Pan241w_58800 [Gimesia alba]|uniref:Phosphoglycolate phosphatase n=1 Tax=Gimesia alba TaxID=2527973 RepID=A0A517RPJ6_9PLAN|nr:hypothetical protein [Gimesia alba]QDT45752.1 hypothetical protein Pan241w_58800 [Gimesia alba]
MPQQSLPAGIKVIFVDWHGVLTGDPFWVSILQNPWHPLHQQLTNAAETLFTQKKDMVRDWMRGNLTANQIVATLKVTPSLEFPPDYLIRKLVEDCQLMQINGPLNQFLQEARKAGIMIVLATDNMDCFHEAIQRARQQTPISTQQKLCETTSFVTAAQLFDDILCSSEQRVLKRENPQRFFSDWLNRHSFDFSDALLLDDLEINCNAFRSSGGTAIQITLEALESTPAVVALEFMT